MNCITPIAQVSSEPGVYLMKDEQGRIIYIGKAANLKKRLAYYFRTEQADAKTSALVAKIASFETVITATEADALILESNLIRKHKPRYNIILRDDKHYPSLRLDIKHQYPDLAMVRRINKDGATYFGPYASPRTMYETLKFINKTFRLRKCKSKTFKVRPRPCLNYQMGLCLAPCCFEVSMEIYNEIVREVILLLRGRTPDLIKKIKQDMTNAAEVLEYEKAAQLRDKMSALENIAQRQVCVSTDLKDKDVIAFAKSSQYCVFTMLFVRGGYLLGTWNSDFREILSEDAEMMGAFIRQYYEKTHFIPEEISVRILPEDCSLIEKQLKEIRGDNVSILQPKRGEKVKLCDMAFRNAQKSLDDLIISANSDTEKLLRLQKRLKIQRLPVRIECFDNSNLSGTSPVAAMAVFENGKPDKKSYRRYRIKTVKEQDDYAYMNEVLRWRFKKDEASKPYPDILMVDGGKGQLNIAVAVIREMGLEKEFDIVAIAKKNEKKGESEDKIFMPGRHDPIQWGREKDLLFFLMQIRDEAHLTAVSFHRRQRRKATVISALDMIPGVGAKRKKMLLTHFRTMKNIQTASIEELTAFSGITQSIAEAIKALK